MAAMVTLIGLLLAVFQMLALPAFASQMLYLLNTSSGDTNVLFRDSTSVGLRVSSSSLGFDLVIGEPSEGGEEPSLRGLVPDSLIASEKPFNMSHGPKRLEDSGDNESVAAFSKVLPEELLFLNGTCPPDYVPECLFVDIIPEDGSLGDIIPYGIQMIQADHPDLPPSPSADSNPVSVCVIDDGLDYEHEDLRDNRVSGCETRFFNASLQAAFPWDTEASCLGLSFLPMGSHGTHVTGIIAALANNVGVVGVNPQGLPVHVINAFGRRESVTSSDIYSSIMQCVEVLEENKARDPLAKMVINLSLGGSQEGPPQVGEVLLNRVAARGDILVVAASGNSGPFAPVSYPGGHAGVISVGAVRCSGYIADFSQVNPSVDISAPGVAVLSPVTPFQQLEATLLVAMGNSTVPFNASLVLGNTLSSWTDTVGDIVDCGRPGRGPCFASGAICLFALEPRRLYSQVCEAANICARGRGIGAVVYVRTRDPCVNNLKSFSCGTRGGPAIPMIGLSRADGEVVRSLVANASTNASTSANASTPTGAVLLYHVGMFNYDYMDGTSMATPYVSGAAARLWSLFPGCSAAEVREALEKTARRFDGKEGRDDAYGHGVVQIKDAYDYLRDKPCALQFGL